MHTTERHKRTLSFTKGLTIFYCFIWKVVMCCLLWNAIDCKLDVVQNAQNIQTWLWFLNMNISVFSLQWVPNRRMETNMNQTYYENINDIKCKITLLQNILKGKLLGLNQKILVFWILLLFRLSRSDNGAINSIKHKLHISHTTTQK